MGLLGLVAALVAALLLGRAEPSAAASPGTNGMIAFVVPAGDLVLDPQGIVNLKDFLDTCPTEDPVYPQIRDDFKIRREGVPVSEIPCSGRTSTMPLSEYSDELIVLQGLRVIYHMEGGRSVDYPWTSGALYDWMKSKIGGIDIRAVSSSFCCESFDGKNYIVVGAQDDSNRDLDRSWSGISGNIDLYAHEARHVDGFPHVSACGIPSGCDQTYDEANLSPYAIQWWLNANWLNGNLYVGFSCLGTNERADIANWHLAATNLFRSKFVDVKPPILTMPSSPGGICRLTPSPSPTPGLGVPLAVGWNAVPYNGAALPVEQALGNCLASVDAVFLWDAAAQSYSWWFKEASAGVNTLATLSGGMILWVRAGAACNWVQPS